MNSPSQHIDVKQAKWFAVRTQFRKEKFLVNQLVNIGVQAYVPILKIKRQYKSRSKLVELPLIPNYAFVKITKEAYVKVLRAQGFLSFVHFSGAIIPIPEREMEILMVAVAEEEILKCSTEHLAKGDFVEIKSGVLLGMQGQLVEENGKRGFVVRLERLGVYLTMAIESHLLRKIKTAS